MGKFDDIDLGSKKTMDRMVKRHQEIQAEKPDRAKELALALLNNPWIDPSIKRVLELVTKRWAEEDKQKDALE